MRGWNMDGRQPPSSPVPYCAFVCAPVPSVLNGLHAHDTVADAYGSMHSLMRLGQHDAGQQLSLEAMAYPNHFLAHDHTGVIVMQPVSGVDKTCKPGLVPGAGLGMQGRNLPYALVSSCILLCFV